MRKIYFLGLRFLGTNQNMFFSFQWWWLCPFLLWTVLRCFHSLRPLPPNTQKTHTIQSWKMESFCLSCPGWERNLLAILNNIVESAGVLSDFKAFLFSFSSGMLYTFAAKISDLKCLWSYKHLVGTWGMEEITLDLGGNIWLRPWCSATFVSVSHHVKYFIWNPWPHSILMVTPWASYYHSHYMAGRAQV